MLSLLGILICIGVQALAIQALVLKGATLTFRKRGLSWGTTILVSLIMWVCGICSSVIGQLISVNAVSMVIQLLCIIALFIIPIIIIRRSLQIRTLVSIGIVVVTIIVSSIVGIGYAYGFRAYVVQAFRIPSAGMSPALATGDFILANKLVYRTRSPSRGEVVVFRYPLDTSKDFVKRIIAIGGDTVDIRDKKVYINSKPYESDPGTHLNPEVLPASASPRDNLSPVTVPAGSFFVLGDNRDNNLDSRFWGLVKSEHIVGRASLIYWSYDSEGHRIRTERIGRHVR